MRTGAALTCRARMKLGGRDAVAARGRRERADFSPPHTLLRRRSFSPHVFASHPDGASSWAWKHLSGKAAKLFIVSSGEAKTHLCCHLGSPVAVPGSRAEPGSAGSIWVTLMCPGQTPLVPELELWASSRARSGSCPLSGPEQHRKKEVSRGK